MSTICAKSGKIKKLVTLLNYRCVPHLACSHVGLPQPVYTRCWQTNSYQCLVRTVTGDVALGPGMSTADGNLRNSLAPWWSQFNTRSAVNQLRSMSLCELTQLHNNNNIIPWHKTNKSVWRRLSGPGTAQILDVPQCKWMQPGARDDLPPTTLICELWD